MVKEEVGADDIAEVISSWTGIPAGRMLEGETAKLLRMEESLQAKVVGQAEAVAAVSGAVRRARAGVADPDRPTGSFLFLGPTGVGKTELAKALAGFLFDDERAMVRIDMSEYGEKHSVARLVGAPPGYVGYEEGGQLTEAVRRRPYSVVLLDEVEKAHPDVFDVLLQVLDDGRLTDGQGRTVDFRNAILVLTSNLGSSVISDFTLGEEERREEVMATVRAHFKPEFLNRLDDIVVFHALTAQDLAAIVDIQLGRLRTRLADRRLSLEVTEAAVLWLGEHGYDPIYGARPLRRLVQSSIGDSLAKALLAGEIADGDTVLVDLSDSKDALSVSRAMTKKGPGISRGPSVCVSSRRLPLPVGVGHEDVREGMFTLVGPDPDAVADELIANVFVAGSRVVMVHDGQGVCVGHGTHRSLSGLGRPRCGHAAGAIGRVPGSGLPGPRRSVCAGGDSVGQAASPEVSAASGASRDGSVWVGIDFCRPLNERPHSGDFSIVARCCHTRHALRRRVADTGIRPIP